MRLSTMIRSMGRRPTKRSMREAGSTSVFYYIIPQKELFDIQDKIADAGDEQTAELFMDVCRDVSRQLQLSSQAAEAFARLVAVAKNYKTWKPDLIRNNVFKAANALGFKLPSHNF